MKKEFLIVLSVVLVVVIVASGLWLGYYTVDSQRQKQTYETLAVDFLLEEPVPSLSLAEDDPPRKRRFPRKRLLLRLPRRPATTWRPCKVKIPTAWDGSPSRTPLWTIPWCGHLKNRNTTSGGTSTETTPAAEHPFWMDEIRPEQRAKISSSTATTCWTAPCSSRCSSISHLTSR